MKAYKVIGVFIVALSIVFFIYSTLCASKLYAIAGQDITDKVKSDTNIISDYLTLIVWIVNRARISPEAWKTGSAILDKHGLEEAIVKGSVMMPESFQMILVSSGFAFKFGAAWVDPLPEFLDRRGDFPPIKVRNGSVSPVDDKVSLQINIGNGTEVIIDGGGYAYKGGKWKKV